MIIETLTILSFSGAVLVTLAVGISIDWLKNVVTGGMFLIGGLVIGWIWSSQCPFDEFIILQCNPKGAIFLGMGVGLFLAAASSSATHS